MWEHVFVCKDPTRSRFKVLLKMCRNILVSNGYCSINHPRCKLRCMRNLTRIVLLKPCFKIACHAYIVVTMCCNV